MFIAKPKKWGNSIGITIPNDIVKKAKLKKNQPVEIIVVTRSNNLSHLFGTLDLKKPTQKLLDEIDKELYDDD